MIKGVLCATVIISFLLVKSAPSFGREPLSSPQPKTTAAPADAYFGPFGMSPLSIRSKIGLLGRQYHGRTISDHDLLHTALDVENALRKWRTAYPADPWLPPTFFHLEQLYQAVQTDEAHKHATAILKDVVAAYPNTKEGHLSRSRLAAGFPPLVAETPLIPLPAPAAMQTPLAADGGATAGAPSPPTAASAGPLPPADSLSPSRSGGAGTATSAQPRPSQSP